MSQPPQPSPYDHNRDQWDRYAEERHRYAQPGDEGYFNKSMKEIDPQGWMGDSVHGKRILCLASAGGKIGPLLASHGARVVVADLSPKMLAIDDSVAMQKNVSLETIATSMDDLSELQQNEFDIVIQDVSTCYVPDVRRVYHEVARVMKQGGLYISQHKQPTSLQGSEALGESEHYELIEPYYGSGHLPPTTSGRHREAGMFEYLHRWEDLVGGLCENGFVIEGLYEPCYARASAPPGTFAHRCKFLPPYVRIKARRVGELQEYIGTHGFK